MVQLSRPGWRAVTAATALLAGLATLPSAPAAAAPEDAASDKPRIVADHLNNPRHLRWQHGSLYIAEAGTGGDGPCVKGAEGDTCLGATGSITRVRHGAQRRVVRGLPSLAGQGEEGAGEGAIGPADVRVHGQRYTVALGLALNPQDRADLGRGGRRLGTVSTGRLGDSRLRVLADIAAFEALSNPDGETADDHPVLDTNPVALLSRGKRTYVVDAGGDALLRYRRNHDVSAAAVFADVPTPGPGGATVSMDAVPTAAAYGPDGAIYVSQLTGFPFPVGGASIWRVVPGKAPTKYATGLTNVTDLAFGKGGVLYAVQLTNKGLLEPGPGSVVRIPKGGGADHTVVADELNRPYGIALRGGSAYVTTCATCPGEGQVLRLPLGSS